MKNILRTSLLVLAVFGTLTTTTVRADEVADWNRNLFEAARLNNPPTSPLVMTRNSALVQAAVFDAINGVERRPAAPDAAHAAAHDAADRLHGAVLCTI